MLWRINTRGNTITLSLSYNDVVLRKKADSNIKKIFDKPAKIVCQVALGGNANTPTLST